MANESQSRQPAKARVMSSHFYAVAISTVEQYILYCTVRVGVVQETSKSPVL